MVGRDGIERYENEIKEYFPCCPFCGNNQLTVSLVPGGKDTLSCKTCNAHWHLFIGLGGLKCAILDQPSQNGKGKNFVGKRYEKSQWQKFIQKSKADDKPSPLKETLNEEATQIIREKEIITQKEVIIKIRCSYCKTPYNETLDKCPNCGAKT